VAGGRDEGGVGEGGQFTKRAGEFADVGAGRNELGRAGEVEAEGVEDLAAPLFLVEFDELGVGGVGVLGDARAAPVGEQILGQVEPLLAFGKAGELVGVELVDGVEGKDLDAGELAHALLAALAVGGALGLDGARIAIAEGIGERIAGGIHADVVHGPAIDGDGANAFGGELGALAQALNSTPETMALRSQRRPPSISRGLLGKRWTSSMAGRPDFQRSRETRQLSAPRSMAMEALWSLGFRGLPSELFMGSFIAGRPRSNRHRRGRCGRWCRGYAARRGRGSPGRSRWGRWPGGSRSAGRKTLPARCADSSSPAFSSKTRLYFFRLAITRSRGNMVEPFTTVAGLMALTRILGE
jgi:hypothetical protein